MKRQPAGLNAASAEPWPDHSPGGGADNETASGDWRRRRVVARSLFDRRSDDRVEHLQRFVVEQLLLALAGYF